MRLASTQALGMLRRLGKPVFSTADAALCLRRTLPTTTRTLSRLAGAGLVLRIRHGLWSIDPRMDPLLLPEYLTAPFPAYVSLQTALQLHGMISQVPHVIYVASLAPTRKIVTQLGNYSVHRLGPSFFGGFDMTAAGVRLARPEKALLDVLYLGPARNRLFVTLPEVELPRSFSLAEARRWLDKVPPGPRRVLMQRRLKALLEKARPRRTERPRHRGRPRPAGGRAATSARTRGPRGS